MIDDPMKDEPMGKKKKVTGDNVKNGKA